NMGVEKLRDLLRISTEMRFMSFDQLEYATRSLNQIGSLVIVEAGSPPGTFGQRACARRDRYENRLPVRLGVDRARRPRGHARFAAPLVNRRRISGRRSAVCFGAALGTTIVTTPRARTATRNT